MKLIKLKGRLVRVNPAEEDDITAAYVASKPTHTYGDDFGPRETDAKTSLMALGFVSAALIGAAVFCYYSLNKTQAKQTASNTGSPPGPAPTQPIANWGDQ
jgi:hypothetical protein